MEISIADADGGGYYNNRRRIGLDRRFKWRRARIQCGGRQTALETKHGSAHRWRRDYLSGSQQTIRRYSDRHHVDELENQRRQRQGCGLLSAVNLSTAAHPPAIAGGTDPVQAATWL